MFDTIAANIIIIVMMLAGYVDEDTVTQTSNPIILILGTWQRGKGPPGMIFSSQGVS